MALAVFGVYSVYTPFDAWWYLRFLLPAWPALFIGTAALLVGLARGRAAWFRALTMLAVLALGLHGVRDRAAAGRVSAGRRGAALRHDRRARRPRHRSVERDHHQRAHAALCAYYSGRLTVRYDVLDQAWLDRAVEWLAGAGRRPYILLEEQEVAEFRQRFRGARAVSGLDRAPILIYEADQIAGQVYLFDPLGPVSQTWQPAPIRDPQPRCPRPIIGHSSLVPGSLTR